MSPYDKIISLPETMEIAVRKKDDKQYLFVLNYGKQADKITFYQNVKDIYTNQDVSGSLMINAYGTLVVEI